MSDPERVPPSGGPGHWRRWLLPVLASAAWLVLTFCLYRHAVQGEQAHLLELCHTRLAATAHQLMDARDWNAGHGGVYVPLSAYGEPNPWLPEKDRTLQTADGRTLVLMNPAYMSRQMAERLTEPGFRLAIVGQAPLRPGNRADDWERRILATATQGGQVFFSGEDCLPQGRLRLLRTLAAQESCLRCHQGHKEGDMLGGISISMDAAAYVRDLERKQRELGLLYGLLALTGVLAVGGITSNLTLRRLQAEEKSRLKSAFMGRLSHDMRTPLAAMLGMSDLLDRQDCGTEQRHMALAYLRRACGALLEMVDDITDHASLEQGDVRLRCRTFDLPACLRACADLYRPAAEGKGLELLLHLAPHLPRQVRGDGFRLRQALGNLVSNAVKFTEQGRVDVEAGGGRLASGVFLLRLDVRDSGPGLEPGVPVPDRAARSRWKCVWRSWRAVPAPSPGPRVRRKRALRLRPLRRAPCRACACWWPRMTPRAVICSKCACGSRTAPWALPRTGNRSWTCWPPHRGTSSCWMPVCRAWTA